MSSWSNLYLGDRLWASYDGFRLKVGSLDGPQVELDPLARKALHIYLDRLAGQPPATGDPNGTKR